jgi:hypothetical protein
MDFTMSGSSLERARLVKCDTINKVEMKNGGSSGLALIVKWCANEYYTYIGRTCAAAYKTRIRDLPLKEKIHRHLL